MQVETRGQHGFADPRVHAAQRFQVGVRRVEHARRQPGDRAAKFGVGAAIGRMRRRADRPFVADKVLQRRQDGRETVALVQHAGDRACRHRGFGILHGQRGRLRPACPASGG
jgi:hypothetical protein